MAYKNNKIKLKHILVAGSITCIAFSIFGLIGIGLWQDYKNDVINNQKKQMLLVTGSISANLEANLLSYKDDIDFLIETKASENSLEKYVLWQNKFVFDVIKSGSSGEMIHSVKGYNIKEIHSKTKIDKNTYFSLATLENNKKYLIISKEENDSNTSIVIDGQTYYKSIMSDIKLGSSGYVVIKDSSGIILMYPNERQLGIDVISGRKKLFSNVDLTSLEQMIKEQAQGKEGVSEYYSYWWNRITENNSKDARVKKISAYSPVNLGGDFLIVSAVIDYDDVFIPIADGYMKMVLLFVIIIVIILIAVIMVSRLLIRQKHDTEKIEYLTGLNEVLEELRKGEEKMAHNQRLQILGTMTGGIAHEFNNLLTPILGYADLMLLELPEDSEMHEDALEIRDTSLKAKEIIQQLSAMSRKNIETVFKRMNMKDVLKRSIKMVQSIRPTNIELTSDIKLTNQQIIGNKTQISQVILNICLNAIQAIGSKAGEINLKADIVKSNEIKALKTNDTDSWHEYISISIEDNGSGMAKEVLKQIFQPFYTTKRQGQGTGLGLALVEQIINAHKGIIQATSTEGKGSCFTIYLPRTDLVSFGDTDMLKGISVEKRFLVVDDNPKILNMLQKNFKKLSIAAEIASDLNTAKQVLETMPVNVMIIDQFLNGNNVSDFCIRARGTWPELIIIVAIEHTDKEIIEAKKSGIIDDYIEKPLSDIEIIGKIRVISKID